MERVRVGNGLGIAGQTVHLAQLLQRHDHLDDAVVCDRWPRTDGHDGRRGVVPLHQSTPAGPAREEQA